MFSKLGFAALLASAVMFMAGIQRADCSTGLAGANFWFAL